MTYSVIIPIYNAEKTLARCIESLTAQGREDVELLLINDGSTDRSEEICKEYQQKCGNIRYFVQENRGVSAARNVGLAEAQGEYVLFVDSDDYVSHAYFETIDAALAKEKADLLLFGEQYTSGEKARADYGEAIQGQELNIYQKLNLLLRGLQLDALHSKVFRRDIIRQQGLHFQENLAVGEDTLFVFTYILHIHNIWAENIPVYYTDVSNGESLTRKYRPYLCDQLMDVHKRMFSLVKDCDWPESEKKSIQATVTWSFYRSAYSVCKDLRKGNMTPKERREKIRKVCDRFMEESIKPADWKCRLIAIPVQMRMAMVIDGMTGLREIAAERKQLKE